MDIVRLEFDLLPDVPAQLRAPALRRPALRRVRNGQNGRARETLEMQSVPPPNGKCLYFIFLYFYFDLANQVCIQI